MSRQTPGPRTLGGYRPVASMGAFFGVVDLAMIGGQLARAGRGRTG